MTKRFVLAFVGEYILHGKNESRLNLWNIAARIFQYYEGWKVKSVLNKSSGIYEDGHWSPKHDHYGLVDNIYDFAAFNSCDPSTSSNVHLIIMILIKTKKHSSFINSYNDHCF